MRLPIAPKPMNPIAPTVGISIFSFVNEHHSRAESLPDGRKRDASDYRSNAAEILLKPAAAKLAALTKQPIHPTRRRLKMRFAYLAVPLLALSACATIHRQEAADSEVLLKQAGFEMRAADSGDPELAKIP